MLRREFVLLLPFLFLLVASSMALATPDITTGLVSHYKFDEGTGTTTADEQGINDGNLSGAFWNATGISGSAVQFNQTTDYVTIGNDTSLSISGDIAISIWFNPFQLADYTMFFNKNPNREYEFYYANVVVMFRFLRMGTYPPQECGIGGGYFDDKLNTWTHIVASVNGTSGKLFINGVQNCTFFASSVTLNSTEPVYIGNRAWNGDTNYAYPMKMDEVRLYNRSLTAEDVSEVYNETLNPPNTTAPPVTQQVVLPSLPSASNQMKCYANITYNGTGNISAYYEFWRNNGSGYAKMTDGWMNNVINGTLINVANLSGSYVTANSQFFCVVAGFADGQLGNATSSSYVTALNRASFTLFSNPVDTNLGDYAYPTLYATNSWSNPVYMYQECNFQSPSSYQFYPNDTTKSYGCVLASASSVKSFTPRMIMNETGTWELKSCALYLSNYSDCRYSDLALAQETSYSGKTWGVSIHPIVLSAYITPSSPKGNNNLYCYATLTTIGNTTFTAQTDWILDGGIWGTQTNTNVTNNTLTLVSTLPSSQILAGDNISCRVRGVDGGDTGSWTYSSPVTVIDYAISGISTTPEPSIFGDVKELLYTSERQVATTRIEMLKPDNTTAQTYISNTPSTSVAVIFPSGSGTNFNISGTYAFTIKACNCPSNQFDTINCPSYLCAYPSDYPTKSRSMVFTQASNYYLYDVDMINVTYGMNQYVHAHFSQPTNIFDVVITYPDSSTQKFRSTINNDTIGTFILTSGSGANLNQIGTYYLDAYGAYGWIGNGTDCTDTSSCSYQNTSVGHTFTIAYGSGGFIANLTKQPSTIFYGNTFNISLDTSLPMDSVCFVFRRPITYIPQAVRITNSSVTHWKTAITTGDGGFLNVPNLYDAYGNPVGWYYDVKACNNNGSSVCQNSDCTITSQSNCDYCAESDNNSIVFGSSTISNVTYKNQIAIGEAQIINFLVSGGSNHTQIHLPSLILNEQDVDHSQISPSQQTAWSITIPYNEIQQAICSQQNTTLCVYGNIPFVIRAFTYDLQGNMVTLQSNAYYFSVNTSTLLDTEERALSNQGTEIGMLMGSALGLPAWVGDMIFAMLFTILFTGLGAVAISKISPNSPASGIIIILIFLSFIGIFSIAGMLPVWIPLILIIIGGSIIAKWVSSGFLGGT